MTQPLPSSQASQGSMMLQNQLFQQMNQNNHHHKKKRARWPTWGTLVNAFDPSDVVRLTNHSDFDSPQRNFTSPKFIIGRHDHVLTDAQMKEHRSDVISSNVTQPSSSQLFGHYNNNKNSNNSASSLGDSENGISRPDLKIDSPLVSGIHCILQVIRKVPVLVDKSSNGVFINGKRVPKDQRVKLFKGDEIQLVHKPSFQTAAATRSSSGHGNNIDNSNNNHHHHSGTSTAADELFKYVAVYRYLPHLERDFDVQQIDEPYFSQRPASSSSSSSTAASLFTASLSSMNNNNNNNNNSKNIGGSSSSPSSKTTFHISSEESELFHRTMMMQPHNNTTTDANNPRIGQEAKQAARLHPLAGAPSSSSSPQQPIYSVGTTIRLPQIFSGGNRQKMVEVGRGGTSIVYVALDGVTGCKVAVKEILKPERLTVNRMSSLAPFESSEYRRQQIDLYAGDTIPDGRRARNEDAAQQQNDVPSATTAAAASTRTDTTTSTVLNTSQSEPPFPRQNTANASEIQAERQDGAPVKQREKAKQQNKNHNTDKNNNEDAAITESDAAFSSDGFSSSSSSSSDDDDGQDDDDDDDFLTNFAQNNPERKKISDMRAMQHRQQQSKEGKSCESDRSLPTPVGSQSTQAGESSSSSPLMMLNNMSKQEEYEQFKKVRREQRLAKKRTQQQQLQNGHANNNNNKDESTSNSNKMNMMMNMVHSGIDLSELNILLNVRNPRVVQLLGFEDLPDRWRIYMEYVSGGSLNDLIHSFGGMMEHVVRVYLLEILLGLDYLHREKNLVHGDLKPQNILIAGNGDDGLVRVRITDFGTSYFLAEKSGGNNNLNNNNNNQTSSVGAPIGAGFTPIYCAPEMVRNHTGATKASDIWALGCVVYEMSTGVLPWQVDNQRLFAPENFYSADFPMQLLYFISRTTRPPSLEVLHKPVPNPEFQEWSEIYANDYNELMNRIRNLPTLQQQGILEGEFASGRLVEPPPTHIRGPPLVSESLIDFINQCWDLDPTRRPTAEELLNHRFIIGNELTLEKLKEMKLRQLQKVRTLEFENEMKALNAAASTNNGNGSNNNNNNNKNGNVTGQQHPNQRGGGASTTNLIMNSLPVMENSQQQQSSQLVGSGGGLPSSMKMMMMVRLNSDAAAATSPSSSTSTFDHNHNHPLHGLPPLIMNEDDDEAIREEEEEEENIFNAPGVARGVTMIEKSSSSDSDRFIQLSGRLASMQSQIETMDTAYFAEKSRTTFNTNNDDSAATSAAGNHNNLDESSNSPDVISSRGRGTQYRFPQQQALTARTIRDDFVFFNQKANDESKKISRELMMTSTNGSAVIAKELEENKTDRRRERDGEEEKQPTSTSDPRGSVIDRLIHLHQQHNRQGQIGSVGNSSGLTAAFEKFDIDDRAS